MRLTAICFSEEGAATVRQLVKSMKEPEVTGYYKTKQLQEGLSRIEGSTEELVERCFAEHTPVLFVGACGIAVRLIAPFLKDKLSDIPVLVMDEACRYVIPILSGHAGGANRLASFLADAVGAVPVITTATDVQDTFSVDTFAVDHRLTIENKEGIRQVSAKALRGEAIRIHIVDDADQADVLIAEHKTVDAALWLSPKNYVLGIGCKKGKTVEEIEAAAERVMNELGIEYRDIYAFASVDLKEDEQGLLDFSARHRLPFVTFSAERLNRVEGDFNGSEFVQRTVGVDNVCERAAVLLAGGGKPVAGKHAMDGVTVAVAKRRGR